MREFAQKCGKCAKMRVFPHDCGTVDTYGNWCVSLDIAYILALRTSIGDSDKQICFFMTMK